MPPLASSGGAVAAWWHAIHGSSSSYDWTTARRLQQQQPPAQVTLPGLWPTSLPSDAYNLLVLALSLLLLARGLAALWCVKWYIPAGAGESIELPCVLGLDMSDCLPTTYGRHLYRAFQLKGCVAGRRVVLIEGLGHRVQVRVSVSVSLVVRSFNPMND